MKTPWWKTDEKCPSCGSDVVRTQSGKLCCSDYLCGWYDEESTTGASGIALAKSIARRAGRGPT